MSMLSPFLPFVNDQFSFHEKMAERYASDPRRSEKHRKTAAQFKDLIEAMEILDDPARQLMRNLQGHNPIAELPTAVPPATKKTAKLYLDLQEIEGLPDELIQELSVSEGDKIDYVIIRSVEECGGVASIDRILLSLYRKTNEVMKRTTLTSRLYRLVQKGQLFSVAGKKGVYSSREMTPEEASQLD